MIVKSITSYDNAFRHPTVVAVATLSHVALSFVGCPNVGAQPYGIKQYFMIMNPFFVIYP